MKNTPHVSIIIPIYNRAKLVPRAIKSVLNQTRGHWELILVDDCSTDNIDEVISTYDDERIKFFKLPVNKGNAGARNEGVRQATGEFIFFLDSDDEMHPTTLDFFLKKYIENPKIDFAFGAYQTKNEVTGEITEVFWQPKENVPFIKELKIGTGCGLFVQKDIFDKVGLFDERLRVAVDTDWLIRLDNLGFKPTLLKDILVTVNIHKGERVRKDRTNLLNAYKIIFQKNRQLIFQDNFLIKKFLYKLQWLSYHSKNLKAGNSFFYKQIGSKTLTLKPFVAFLIYNILPLETAKKIHLKISGSNI
ncbi:glycosyltransferase family 2 protein [Salegentibacter maritimus]|uniref:Glycosyltransferase family 2 protein n=1 Tax=Salegentibacter maritimus TaxID=2794347 RepID=A0ABS0TFD5_9FLAO|nr:glycosyltransferase family A protein [Salegentibacter maritimus]MBI6119767.1 glycosyltransferase family 2 protein [Salegentibacter maritimus]